MIANYSNLTPAQFWAQMQASDLLLPLNNGVPQVVNTATGAPIPTSLTGLTNDPYRGLEYGLKNKSSKLFKTTGNITGAVGSAIAGLDKVTGLYSDFIWAAAYRDAKNGLGLPFCRRVISRSPPSGISTAIARPPCRMSARSPWRSCRASFWQGISSRQRHQQRHAVERRD